MFLLPWRYRWRADMRIRISQMRVLQKKALCDALVEVVLEKV
jgi:hypothetical protein